ncbi:hypothetical protein [Mariniluteicoccus flavus]
MTQAQAWPPPGPGQQPVGVPAPPRPGRAPGQATAPSAAGPRATVQTRSRASSLSTPKLLRLLLALSILTTLVFGATTAAQLIGGSNSLGEATHHTRQLTRIQAIQANLLKADATATNAFLVGGLESPEQRAQYVAALDEVARLVPEAGEAQPADSDALRALNVEVVAYAATMEQARANNRQGFPVGSAYLADAGTHLRARAMPLLDSLVTANTARVQARMDPFSRTAVVLTGILALGALGLTLVLVAQRFRRLINVGLAIALGLVLVALVSSLSTIDSSAGSVASVRRTTLADARAAGAARVHAYDAKAFESLTLIARSRGGEYEAQWARSSLLTRRALASAGGSSLTRLEQAWTAHTVSHRRIRELDLDGRWDLARAEATGTGPRSSNATFAAFDEAATATATSSARNAATSLDGLRLAPLVSAGIVVLACLGSLVAATIGVNRRLKEYA